MNAASPPADSIIQTVSLPPCSSTSFTQSLAPSWANRSAAARPRPPPEPVIRHTFPSSSIVLLLGWAVSLQSRERADALGAGHAGRGSTPGSGHSGAPGSGRAARGRGARSRRRARALANHFEEELEQDPA